MLYSQRAAYQAIDAVAGNAHRSIARCISRWLYEPERRRGAIDFAASVSTRILTSSTAAHYRNNQACKPSHRARPLAGVCVTLARMPDKACEPASLYADGSGVWHLFAATPVSAILAWRYHRKAASIAPLAKYSTTEMPLANWCRLCSCLRRGSAGHLLESDNVP